MFRVGLVGLGFMGSGHLNSYIQLEKDGQPVKLVAVCDVDEAKFKAGSAVEGNLDIGGSKIDLSPYNLYNCMEEMIEKENLDYVDICLPTYLHGPMSIKAMELGVNVFCEKPMSISSAMCREMIDAVKKTGKLLMIGHTLRYWNVYEYAKECIDKNTYGKCISGYFFRGGSTPKWSWENWLLTNDKSGGCLLDQHVHDVDAINWLFGVPETVSSVGRVVFEGSGYDAVSTNYLYKDMVINAQDDWSMNGKGFGFKMLYRLNFEEAALIYEAGKLTVHPNEGEQFVPELTTESGYYKELRLFLELMSDKTKFDYISLLESHLETILIAEAEIKSADAKGVPAKVK